MSVKNSPDVAAAGLDPLSHYLSSGQFEGRQTYAAIGNAASFTHGSFDAEYYLLANPDVAAAHIDPLTHYLQFGADEERHLA